MKSVKSVTSDRVAKQLMSVQSIEREPDGWRYYLHIASDGSIVDNCHDADATFSVYARYIDSMPESDDMDDVYAAETADHPEFMDICEELAELANVWLKGQENEEG